MSILASPGGGGTYVEPSVLMDWLRGLLEPFGRLARLAGGFKACCPAHGDRNPSLSVKPGDVRVMLYCFAGCSEEAVLGALGITVQDLFYDHRDVRELKSPVSHVRRGLPAESVKPLRAYRSFSFPGLGKPQRVYHYLSELGAPVFSVARYVTKDGKQFRQFVPAGDGLWYRKGPSDDVKVLYRLPQLLEGIKSGAVVCLVEGEKDADNGNELDLEGVVFTSAAGGAKAHWLPQYTQELSGARLVRVITDADEPGREHAAKVVAALQAAGIPVEAVESDRAKDWTDHVAAGGTMADLVPASLPDLVTEDKSAARRSGRPAKLLPSARYVIPEEGAAKGWICREKWEKDSDGFWEPVLQPVLEGASVRIVKTIRPLELDDISDEQSVVTRYVIEATRADTGEIRQFNLSLKDWRSGDWLESLWPDVQFRTDRAGRAEILRAVRQQSADAREEVLHAATGWTTLGGQRAYVHAGGAITASGLVECGNQFPSKLKAMHLEPPSTSAQVAEDMEASMGLLHASWLPARVGVALMGTVYKSILPGISNMVTLMVAPPGAGKTELSMIAAESFFPGMNHGNKSYVSMGALASSRLAVQKMQHLAKDALLVVDDFPAQMSARDTKSGMGQAEFIRATYDKQTRDTMTRDRDFRPGPYARCSVISSAEYAPVDTAARERALVVPMPWGKNPPVDDFIVAQSETQAAARSRFLAWVIQQTAKVPEPEVRSWTVNAADQYSSVLRKMGFQPRPAEHAGNLFVGWSWVVNCLVGEGILSESEADKWLDEVWLACIEAAEANGDPEGDATTDGMLLRLLGVALGRGYLADAAHQDEPPADIDPVDCGWSSFATNTGVQFKANGARLGWVRGDRLLLDPGAVFTMVQRVADDEGVQLPIYSVPGASATLARREDLDFQCDEGRHSRKVKIGGRTVRVWDLPISLFWGDGDSTSSPPLPPVSPVPLPQPALPAPETGDSPVTPGRGVCVVCGQEMIVCDDSDRHPGCDVDTDVVRSGESVVRWRAAEVMLTADAAILPDGTRLALPSGHAGDIAVWAAAQHIGWGGGASRPEPAHVWLSRDFLEVHGLPVKDLKLVEAGRLIEADKKLSTSLAEAHDQHQFFTDALSDGYEFGKTSRSGWLRIWRKGTKISATISSDQWVSMRGLADGDPSPEHLIRRLGLWTKTTRHPLIINEGVTFKTMCHLPGIDLPKLPWADMAADFMWQRQPTEAELGQKWVHCYDRRKSYLAACSSAMASEHLVHVPDPSPDPKRAGFWRVTSTTWADNGFDLPDPRLDYNGNDCEWVATPLLALLLEHSQVEVAEAWLYDDHPTRVTEPAYKAIKAALDEAESWTKDDDVDALIGALKASYRVGIGQMAMTKDEGARKNGHRPDVRATIIATHRANSLRAMILAGAKGVWPLAMARADSVLFASDVEDPVAAWPGREDGMSERLGKYKAAGTQTMSEWARLALVEPLSPSRSIWAVTDPERAETQLQDDWGDDDGSA